MPFRTVLASSPVAHTLYHNTCSGRLGRSRVQRGGPSTFLCIPGIDRLVDSMVDCLLLTRISDRLNPTRLVVYAFAKSQSGEKEREGNLCPNPVT